MTHPNSSRSFVRRTDPGSATPKQIAYLVKLLDTRDITKPEFPAVAADLKWLDENRDRLPECSLAGMSDFIESAKSCPEKGASTYKFDPVVNAMLDDMELASLGRTGVLTSDEVHEIRSRSSR